MAKMSSSLASFLTDHRKGKGKVPPQTHTWFAAGPDRSKTVPLHIPAVECDTLNRLILAYVRETTTKSLVSGEGILSITEKVPTGGTFRFFADIDYKPEDIEAFAAENGDSWHSELQMTLSELVSLYKTVVTSALGLHETRVILATRLPYKIHLHFPDVVVDKATALLLHRQYLTALQAQGNKLFTSNKAAVDASVYATGIRTLWSHKGAMASKNPERVVNERRKHEELFGKDTWTAVYELTDIASWTKVQERNDADLRLTSIISDTVEPTAVIVNVSGGGGERNSKKRVTTATAKGKDKGRKEKPTSAGTASKLSLFLAERFAISEHVIQITEPTRRGTHLIVSTRCRDCPFAQRKHDNNHLYILLSGEGIELRCHDVDCHDSQKIPMESIPINVKEELTNLLKTEVGEVVRLEAIEQSLKHIQLAHPQMDLTDAMTSLRPSTLGGRQGYMLSLSRNRYCPICKREHDAAENCILTTEKLQQIICKRTFGDILTLPLATDLGSLIFANINNNYNVSVNVTTSDSNEVKDFGTYDEFVRPYDDEELNKLCYTSLSGRTRDVAKYASYLMRGEYLYQDKQWYRYTGKYWRVSLGPDDLMTGSMVDTYLELRRSYRTEKQQRWINSLIDDLSNVNKRRGFLEDLERLQFEHCDSVALDGNPYLTGFQNGVYDSHACIFRDHSSSDYLTMLIPYELPAQSDPTTRQNIEHMMTDILPDTSVRNFVMLMLSLCLEGMNRHDVAMIWTGVGGNGKSILKNLMKSAFGEDLHREPPATFLTNERPSSDKPSADLVDVKLVRSLFTSEPQAGKKINTGFLKFLTGRDTIRVRTLNSPTYRDFLPRFLITLLTNAVPLLEGGDEDVRGIWRRLKIVHFATVFTNNPSPDRPNEKKADPTLDERSKSWGAEFMLLLMETYREYVGNGRQISVPREVELNLQEQREENSPLDSWLQENLVGDPGKRVHLHRFEKAFGSKCRSLVNRLQALGHQVGAVDVKKKDFGCCVSSFRCVTGINVRNWVDSERRVVDNFDVVNPQSP